ncbi:MAG TPA: hypothetical protein VL576_03370 [Candidatus Paceibacterota bacterium]|jgi:hypothetical protein|nr:hypothetical protein [Candidatus Paceibacterota bacterium]
MEQKEITLRCLLMPAQTLHLSFSQEKIDPEQDRFQAKNHLMTQSCFLRILPFTKESAFQIEQKWMKTIFEEGLKCPTFGYNLYDYIWISPAAKQQYGNLMFHYNEAGGIFLSLVGELLRRQQKNGLIDAAENSAWFLENYSSLLPKQESV